MKQLSILLFITLIILTSCNKDEDKVQDFGIFSSQDPTTAFMNGTIGSKTPDHWENYFKAFPETNRIIMGVCPGSEDDEANLKAAREIRKDGISIHLPSSGLIASGAVDLFLAGVNRTRESGGQLGVHSWSDGSGTEATDFPVGHANHQPYIEYYMEMGFGRADAESFYYFTINAALAADIHWMTDAEIAQYKLLTQ